MPQSHSRLSVILLAIFLLQGGLASGQEAAFAIARQQMVEREIIGAGVSDPRVIKSMMQTPRHEFVLPKYRRDAYFDMALPIGGEQTISSPFIVSYMTESIDPQPTDRVLEIGTGSGYQAAVLSPLVQDVYTIEIVASLGKKAERLLRRLGYDNVHVKVGDGFQGWPEHAPFDKIVVTCSPESVPQPLVDQLREGGRMVIPVGERYQQTLYLYEKRDGQLEKESLRPTLFVPMTGTAEQQRKELPDPRHPVAINGGFEEPATGEEAPGWYYGRQFKLTSSPETPEGKSHVVFENENDGRDSRLLQGFGIDGRHVTRLKLACWFRCQDVRPSTNETLPSVVVTFYDEERREIGHNWLGPWRGTVPWTAFDKVVRVPTGAREAILRIGMLGATGRAEFDDVRISAEEE